MSERLASRRTANATAAAPAPAQVYRIASNTVAKPAAPAPLAAAFASGVTAASAAPARPAPSVNAAAAGAKPAGGGSGGGGLFSGLKGGFFNNNKSSSKTSAVAPSPAASASASASVSAKSDDGIPFLRAAAGSSTSTSTSGLRAASSAASTGVVLPEVQEAMKQTISSTDWCTPDFLAQLDGDDVLARGLADPRMAKVMDELSKNPQEALRKYGKDPNLQEFIRRFMGLMGSHLTAKAEIAEQTKPKPKQASLSTGPAAPPSRAKIVDPDLHPDSDSEDGDDQDFLIRPAAQQQQPKQQLFVADRPREVDPAQMQRWLSDPRLRAVLSDPDTERMLADIRADPRRVRQYENDARFKMLVEAGIIGRE